MSQPVIITCAITGAIHTPSMSAYLPITSEQIIAQAIEASQAGASILHLHARNEIDGKPDQSVDGFARIIQPIADGCDSVLNITTGGSPFMTVDERVKPAQHFSPELASLNMGSFNFGLFPLLDRYPRLQHDWEREHFEKSRSLIFRNTFADIEFILSTLNGNGTRFEFECYDIGHLYNLAHFVERQLVKPPFFVQSVFGLLGGIGTHPEDIAHMKRTADRLFGRDYCWSVLGAGSNQFRTATHAISMGGHARVGLEDSVWIRKGVLAQSNAEQVTALRTAIEATGGRVATPHEAREMLQLKGRENTAF